MDYRYKRGRTKSVRGDEWVQRPSLTGFTIFISLIYLLFLGVGVALAYWLPFKNYPIFDSISSLTTLGVLIYILWAMGCCIVSVITCAAPPDIYQKFIPFLLLSLLLRTIISLGVIGAVWGSYSYAFTEEIYDYNFSGNVNIYVMTIVDYLAFAGLCLVLPFLYQIVPDRGVYGRICGVDGIYTATHTEEITLNSPQLPMSMPIQMPLDIYPQTPYPHQIPYPQRLPPPITQSPIPLKASNTASAVAAGITIVGSFIYLVYQIVTFVLMAMHILPLENTPFWNLLNLYTISIFGYSIWGGITAILAISGSLSTEVTYLKMEIWFYINIILRLWINNFVGGAVIGGYIIQVYKGWEHLSELSGSAMMFIDSLLMLIFTISYSLIYGFFSWIRFIPTTTYYIPKL